MSVDARTAAARTFLRSLTILLKLSRLYGVSHARTAEQLATAWGDLQAVLAQAGGAGLLLGATGSQLLLEGAPLETTATERSFAELLSSAGIGSLQFLPGVAREDLAHLLDAFTGRGKKSADLAAQLQSALGSSSSIRVNALRFVAEDPNRPEIKLPAELTETALGEQADQVRNWLSDPRKLLELIAAAEGAGHPTGTPHRTAAAARTPPGGPGGLGLAGAAAARDSATDEAELQMVLRLLAQFARQSTGDDATLAPDSLSRELARTPGRTQAILREALAGFAARAPHDEPDQQMLLRLAEYLAIRFALVRYERGEVRVNAVRQLLERLSNEVVELRTILSAHEDKMARAGVRPESHVEILDREFWAAMPEADKDDVLLSPDAWCVPAPVIRDYVERLRRRKDSRLGGEVLTVYASCIRHDELEARRRTAEGLSELAGVYAQGEPEPLVAAIREVGLQMCRESDPGLQHQVSLAFVRLSQESTARHCYPAIRQTMAALDSVEHQRPAFARSLLPKLGIESRIPDFIDEALRSDRIPEGLLDVLRLTPHPAINQIVGRFNRSRRRGDCEHLTSLAQQLGTEGIAHLRGLFRSGIGLEAVDTVGLLSRLDVSAMEMWLPTRFHEWQRADQDRAVRLLASAGAPERSRLLMAVLDALDPLLLPLVLDVISMSGGIEDVSPLIRMAQGEVPGAGGEYVRLKAIEALGRLQAPGAEEALRNILETRRAWRWAYPDELRIAAAQALKRIDPSWTEGFLPRSGLDPADLAIEPLLPKPDAPFYRQRRYQRVVLAHPLPATTLDLANNRRLEVRTLSLGGGGGESERQIMPGTLVTLRLSSGLRTVRVQALVRDVRAQGLGFEFVSMDLEERFKLRHLLAGQLGSTGPSGENSSEKQPDTIPSGSVKE